MSEELLHILREEDVKAAERLEGPYAKHPVVAVLEGHAREISAFNRGYFAIKGDHPEAFRVKQDYPRTSGVFLVDALRKASPFTLEPLAMVAIWSKAMELLPDEPRNSIFHDTPYHRHVFTEVVASVCAVQDAGQEWQQFPRTYLQERRLPEDVLDDRQGAKYVFDQLGDVISSCREIGYYLGGTRQDISKLISRALRGDEKADRELELYRESIRMRKTPATLNILENFGHGPMHMHQLLTVLLKK